MAIAIKHDASKTMAKLRERFVRKTPGAVATAINRTALAGNTAAVRAIQHDLGASSQKSIRRNLALTRATAEKPEAKIFARSMKNDRIPIYELRPQPRTVTRRRPAGGVRYGPTQKLLPASFIAKMTSGKMGVFHRTGDFGRRGKSYLEKIGQLFGPSVALVLGRKRVYSQVQKVIAEKLPGELKRALQFAR